MDFGDDLLNHLIWWRKRGIEAICLDSPLSSPHPLPSSPLMFPPNSCPSGLLNPSLADRRKELVPVAPKFIHWVSVGSSNQSGEGRMVLPASQFISQSDEGHHLWVEGHLNPESNIKLSREQRAPSGMGQLPALPPPCWVCDLEQTTSHPWVRPLRFRARIT